MARFIIDRVWLPFLVALSGLGPVPPHFAWIITSGEFRDMARLAGYGSCMMIESRILLVRLASMAGTTGRTCLQIPPGDRDLATINRRGCITTSLDFVCIADMAGRTGKIHAVGIHVHIDEDVGMDECRIHVAMLHTFATTSLEMATAAGLPACLADVLCDFFQVRLFLFRVAKSISRVGSGRIVTNQAIDVLFGCKIKCTIFPAITDMAG